MMVYRWQGQDGPPRHTCLSWRTPPWSTPTHLDTHILNLCTVLPRCHLQSAEPSSFWQALAPGLKSHPHTVTACRFQMCNSTETSTQWPRGSSYRVAASLRLSQGDETRYQCSQEWAKNNLKSRANVCWLAASQGFITFWILFQWCLTFFTHTSTLILTAVSSCRYLTDLNQSCECIKIAAMTLQIVILTSGGCRELIRNTKRAVLQLILT